MHVRAIAAGLALAGSALAGAIPGTTPVEPKITTTSFLDLYTHAPTKGPQPTSACPSCDVPHPKDWDPNWEKDAVLNDTTKHHKSFKLFAYPADAEDWPREAAFPLHVREYPHRKNIWNWELSPPESTKKQRLNQPKWNLVKGGLQTDGSAPLKNKLYFSLWASKNWKDTARNPNATSEHYQEVLTTDKKQKKYKEEHNAKLEAKGDWSLKRDENDLSAYILEGSKPKGSFWHCPRKDVSPSAFAHWLDPKDVDLDSQFIKDFFDMGEFVYSEVDIEHACQPLVIKVSLCL